MWINFFVNLPAVCIPSKKAQKSEYFFVTESVTKYTRCRSTATVQPMYHSCVASVQSGRAPSDSGAL